MKPIVGFFSDKKMVSHVLFKLGIHLPEDSQKSLSMRM